MWIAATYVSPRSSVITTWLIRTARWASMLRSKSWLMGRGSRIRWSASAMARASGAPISIASTSDSAWSISNTRFVWSWVTRTERTWTWITASPPRCGLRQRPYCIEERVATHIAAFVGQAAPAARVAVRSRAAARRRLGGVSRAVRGSRRTGARPIAAAGSPAEYSAEGGGHARRHGTDDVAADGERRVGDLVRGRRG